MFDCDWCILYYWDVNCIGEILELKLIIEVVKKVDNGSLMVISINGELMLVGYVVVELLGWEIIILWLELFILKFLEGLMFKGLGYIVLLVLLILLGVWLLFCLIVCLLWLLVGSVNDMDKLDIVSSIKEIFLWYFELI